MHLLRRKSSPALASVIRITVRSDLSLSRFERKHGDNSRSWGIFTGLLSPQCALVPTSFLALTQNLYVRADRRFVTVNLRSCAPTLVTVIQLEVGAPGIREQEELEGTTQKKTKTGLGVQFFRQSSPTASTESFDRITMPCPSADHVTNI